MPYVQEDHGMLVPAAFALAPRSSEPAGSQGTAQAPRISVRFELPSGWDVTAPWPEAEDGALEPQTWGDLQGDLVAVGAWSVARFEAGGVEAIVALAPCHARLGATVAAQIGAVVQREVALLGRAPHPRYLFLFGEPGMTGLGGSTKPSSMTLLVGADVQAARAAERVVQLIAHEYHHSWS